MTQISPPFNKVGKSTRYTWGAKIFIALVLVLGCFAYGVYVGVYKAFPYDYVYSLRQLIKSYPLATERNGESRRVAQFEFVSTAADIVFIGDSITEGGIWNEFLPQYNVVNRGVGGDKASDILQRLDSIISVKPKIGLIMVGINDIYQSVPTEEIFNNYTQIIRELQSNGVSIVIQSTIQCDLHRCGQSRVDKVNHLNAMLKTYSKQNKVSYLDLSQLSDNNGLDASLTTDGIHLNIKGYRIWVDLLRTELHRLVGS